MPRGEQCSPTFWSVPPCPSSHGLHGVMQEVQGGATVKEAATQESDGSPVAPLWFCASATEDAQ